MSGVSRPAGTQLEGIPILPSLDISETLCFYRDRLGFSQRVDAGENYLIVRRETIELHFWLTDDRSLCERSSVYIRGVGIGAWHREFRARGVENLSDLMVRPWNMEEFYLHDPHGNLLRFGRVPLASQD